MIITVFIRLTTVVNFRICSTIVNYDSRIGLEKCQDCDAGAVIYALFKLVCGYYIFINFIEWAKSATSLFSFFSQCMDKFGTKLTLYDKSIDGVLGKWTRGGKLEDADKSTELLQDPFYLIFCHLERVSNNNCYQYFTPRSWRTRLATTPAWATTSTDRPEVTDTTARYSIYKLG